MNYKFTGKCFSPLLALSNYIAMTPPSSNDKSDSVAHPSILSRVWLCLYLQLFLQHRKTIPDNPIQHISFELTVCMRPSVGVALQAPQLLFLNLDVNITWRAC